MEDKWWKTSEECDPISLEKISDLQYPPFELTDDEAGRTSLYDGKLLADYWSGCSFPWKDPLTRAVIRETAAEALDAYLATHGLQVTTPVAVAFRIGGAVLECAVAFSPHAPA